MILHIIFSRGEPTLLDDTTFRKHNFVVDDIWYDSTDRGMTWCKYICIKVNQHMWEGLEDDDPVITPEMRAMVLLLIG